jgi:DNA modification methylase
MREEIIGDARLILGDCREVLPTLGKVDAVVTDPPFGIDYRSGYRTDALWVGNAIRNDTTVETRDAALQLLGDAPMLVFGSWKAPRPVDTKMVLTWDKGPALGMGDLSLPWKPSSEEIYVLGSGFVGARDEGAVIYCPPVQSMAKNGRQHPNEKPVELLVRLLKKLPSGLTCDPFMGSGSTGVACVKLGRPFVGCEIEPRYFDIACRRIEEAYRQPRLFDEPPAKPKQGSMFDGEAA